MSMKPRQRHAITNESETRKVMDARLPWILPSVHVDSTTAWTSSVKLNFFISFPYWFRLKIERSILAASIKVI